MSPEILFTPPRRARRRIAGLVIPWMLSRKTFRWRLAPPFPRPFPPLPRPDMLNVELRMVENFNTGLFYNSFIRANKFVLERPSPSPCVTQFKKQEIISTFDNWSTEGEGRSRSSNLQSADLIVITLICFLDRFKTLFSWLSAKSLNYVYISKRPLLCFLLIYINIWRLGGVKTLNDEPFYNKTDPKMGIL